MKLARVVIVLDQRDPPTAMARRWRHEIRAAFAAAGAVVEEIGWSPPGPARSGPVHSPRRGTWLPAMVRRPLVRTYHLGRRLVRAVSRRQRRAVSHRRALAAQLEGAVLVIAESLNAARAVAPDVPRKCRTWALCVPPERPPWGARSPVADALAEADAVDGFLTVSEPDREFVERAAAARRVRVEVFALATHAAATSSSSSSGPNLPTASQSRVARRLLEVAAPQAPKRPRPERLTLVTGFDLKFAEELAARLDARTDLRVTSDPWQSLSQCSPRTTALADGAASILAEWARPSAVWLSRRKRPGQVLVVRLHRYELDHPYPRQILIDNVDAVVYVSRRVGRRIPDELGWPTEKLVYIPNYVDADWLDRPKLSDARFSIGLVGIEWRNKRFDRALDLLSELRRHDPRFSLRVRSVMPWHNRYAWASAEEREFVTRCFERIDDDPFLRGAVSFDPPGRDMARWYRRVGHVLSVSDSESFHLAAAEGMASGAVPVIWQWPGSNEIYDRRWIHTCTRDAVAALLGNTDPDRWAQQARIAKRELRELADPATVVRAWADALHGDVDAARERFTLPRPAAPHAVATASR